MLLGGKTSFEQKMLKGNYICGRWEKCRQNIKNKIIVVVIIKLHTYH